MQVQPRAAGPVAAPSATRLPRSLGSSPPCLQCLIACAGPSACCGTSSTPSATRPPTSRAMTCRWAGREGWEGGKEEGCGWMGVDRGMARCPFGRSLPSIAQQLAGLGLESLEAHLSGMLAAHRRCGTTFWTGTATTPTPTFTTCTTRCGEAAAAAPCGCALRLQQLAHRVARADTRLCASSPAMSGCAPPDCCLGRIPMLMGRRLSAGAGLPTHYLFAM